MGAHQVSLPESSTDSFHIKAIIFRFKIALLLYNNNFCTLSSDTVAMMFQTLNVTPILTLYDQPTNFALTANFRQPLNRSSSSVKNKKMCRCNVEINMNVIENWKEMKNRET